MFLAESLEICDPVLAFDEIMEEIGIEQYLKPEGYKSYGRPSYCRVNMLKTILFSFMDTGYASLRELEDRCKVNLRYMYLMDYEIPSYHCFGDFINEELTDTIEVINNVTTAATAMLSIPAIISLRTSPFSKGFSIFFLISHLTRRIEIGRDNIAHRIPIYAPFRKSTAIAATNEVVFRLSHDFTIITDHTQEFSATLLCSKIYGLDYAATYLNFKKPQYNCSSIIHNLSKAQ